MTDKHDVFICYSHLDGRFVEQLARCLQQAGVSVWYDEDIGSGRSWRKEIEEAIQGARLVLVVLSASSVISDYVRKEISYAVEADKKLLPVLLEAVDIVPVALSDLQWIDARDGTVPLRGITEALAGERDDLEAPEQLPEPPETLELRLRITELEERFLAHVSLPKLGIDATPSAFSSPLDDDDLKELRWYLEQYPRWPAGPDVQRAQRIERQMEYWGRALFDAVFSDATAARVWQLFRDQTDYHQVVTLDCDEPAALRLPWELLADEQGQLFSRGISVRRRLHLGRAPERLEFELPLRILVVVSRPEGEEIGFIDPRASSEALLDAVEPLGRDNCEVEFLHPPTLQALRKRLNQDPPVHVVHFDGHGVYDRDVGLGYLLFEDEKGKHDLGAADRLSNLLVEAKVPLMMLDACQSADIDAPDPYSSVAARLIRFGLHGVIAMQYSVLVPTSKRFFAAFYGALASGATVGQATDEGRADLLADTHRLTLRAGADEKRKVHLRDWFLPALYERRGDPAPFAGAVLRPGRTDSREDLRGSYPEPPHGFVGRGRDLWKLERNLNERMIVVLHGFGGQGKTALAVESGRWLTRTGRFERAAFLSFEHGGEAPWALTQLGHLLCGDDFSTLGSKERRKAVTKELSESPTLIIWDSFESLLEGGNAELSKQALEELLDLGANLFARRDNRLVVTTRDPNLPHRAFHASGQSIRQQLGGLTMDESLDLAGQVLSAGGQERPERAELHRLLRYLGGHPLCIQLVLPHLEECGGVASVIDRFKELYPGFTRGRAEQRNESLEISLSFSLGRLSDEVRQRLPALAVFRGGGLEVQILRITGIHPDDWEPIRSELIKVGLASLDTGVELGGKWQETEFRGNYLRLHPTLIPHLRSRLEKERRRELEERHRRVYQSLSEHLYEKDTKSPQSVRAIARREMPNLRRALDLTLGAGDLDAAIDMARNIERFLNLLGRWRERDAMIEEVDNAVEATGGFGEESLTKAEFLHRSRRGEMLLDRGRAAESEQEFRALLERFEDGADYKSTYDRGTTLHRLGRSVRAQGRPGAAELEYRRALEMLGGMQEDDAKIRQQTSAIHTDLADAVRDQGRYAEAREEYEAAIEIDEKLGDERGAAVDRGQLGTLALAQRDYGEARRRYEEALQAFTKLGETRHRAIFLHQLGRVAEEEGKRAGDPDRRTELLEEAESRYRESLRLFEKIGDSAGAASNANQLAIVAENAGRPADAERWYGRAIELDRAAAATPSELAKHYSNLANILLNVHFVPDEKQPAEFDGRDLAAEAEEWAQKARGIMEDIDDPSVEIWQTYGILARIAEVREDRDAARVWRRKERRTYAGFPGHWANLGKQWGPIARDFGRLVRGILPDERAEKLEAVLQQLSETEDWSNLVTALRRVREGARDADALAEELGLDPEDYLILTKVLAAVEGQSVCEEPEDDFERALRAFAPLLHDVLRVCEGNEELRPQVEGGIKQLGGQEDWQHLAGALERVLDGERDRGALTDGPDELDTDLLGVLLNALDGDEKARSALQQLADEAEENQRNQQQQQVMEAFQQWLQSPAGRQARENLDTADMSEQQILQSLFQRFIDDQHQPCRQPPHALPTPEVASEADNATKC